MKYINYINLILIALVASLSSTSCTENNGNIGDWFGEWHLKSIDINGKDNTEYQGDVLWKFQNNIIEMIAVNQVGHSHTEHYGTWSADDSILTLNYTHSDESNEAGTGKYAPPAQTMLPSAIIELRILQLSSSKIILQYNPEPESSIVYTLHRRG